LYTRNCCAAAILSPLPFGRGHVPVLPLLQAPSLLLDCQGSPPHIQNTTLATCTAEQIFKLHKSHAQTARHVPSCRRRLALWAPSGPLLSFASLLTVLRSTVWAGGTACRSHPTIEAWNLCYRRRLELCGVIQASTDWMQSTDRGTVEACGRMPQYLPYTDVMLVSGWLVAGGLPLLCGTINVLLMHVSPNRSLALLL
jgi:hypothetical protein